MIKRSPDDFKVDEVMTAAALALQAASGPFALYKLSKESLATPEAVGRASRALNVPSGSFAYAGLKDKHAKTSQHVSLKLDSREAPEKAEGSGWNLDRLGYLPRPITSSDIECNRFTITLRNLTAQDCADIDSACELLGADGCLRIVNYFGDQRFGSARHGQGFIARRLIEADFEGALKLAIATEARKDRMEQKVFKRAVLEHWGDWRKLVKILRPCAERKAIERLANSSGDFRAAFCALPYLLQQLSVYAYQSHLWNSIARRLVEQLCAPRGRVLAAEDVFGEMLFPASEAIAPELLGLQLPLLARKTTLSEPWKKAAEDVLNDEGITVEKLQIEGVRRPFFGEEPRALFFAASNFQKGPAEIDESASDRKRRKRTLSFSLPRGAYATVLLRALGQ